MKVADETHRPVAGAVLAGALAVVLAATVWKLPREHAALPAVARQAMDIAGPAWHTLEPVNEVVYGSRGFDTFGETFLLLAAVGGAALALVQDDLKRLLAYDTVSQMGVLLVGLAADNATGLAGTTYHLVDHALFKALLFLCAGSIVHMTGATKLSDMGGLAGQYPLIAGAFTVGVLSIAGVPPFDGYVSLGLVHDALRSSHQMVPLALLLLAQMLTMAALGRAAWLAFFRGCRCAGPQAEHLRSLRPGMVAALVLLAAACLGLGLFPHAVIDRVAAPAASGLLHPAAYASAVLAGGGTLPPEHVTFSYWELFDLLAVAGTVALAVPCAVAAERLRKAPVVQLARRVQSGSVNDYAAYLVAGLVVAVAVVAR